MTKNTMIVAIALLLILLVHAVVIINKLDTSIKEYQKWFEDTDIKIEQLKVAAQEMSNICNAYLQSDILFDYGNDQSTK